MPRKTLVRWWRRRSTDDPSRSFGRYERQAEVHGQAAETAQRIGSEAAYARQVELQTWYNQEAEKLRRRITEAYEASGKPMSRRAENLAYLLPMVRCVRLGSIKDLASLPDETLEEMAEFIRSGEAEHAKGGEDTHGSDPAISSRDPTQP